MYSGHSLFLLFIDASCFGSKRLFTGKRNQLNFNDVPFPTDTIASSCLRTALPVPFPQSFQIDITFMVLNEEKELYLYHPSGFCYWLYEYPTCEVSYAPCIHFEAREFRYYLKDMVNLC